jgi:hypothetical protein
MDVSPFGYVLNCFFWAGLSETFFSANHTSPAFEFSVHILYNAIGMPKGTRYCQHLEFKTLLGDIKLEGIEIQ